MAEPSSGISNRRLAAVMFLDMVGYSALMARSEASAILCVKDLEGLLRTEVPAAGGRLVKSLGDGSIAEFPTAGAAVACARRILAALAARKAEKPDCPFDIRIGLHLGELLEEAGDIFGDAVNIAARVMPLADPGGIAMTGTVHAQVKNQGELRGAFLPPARLKNIPDRISIFAVPPAGASLTAWKLRRRGIPAAAGTLAGLLLLGGAWGLWRAVSRPGTPTITLFYVKGPEKTQEWRRLAKSFDDRMIFRGAMIRGFRWQDRDLALAKMDKPAMAGFNFDEEGAETRACALLKELGIDFAIYAHLGRGKKQPWKVDYAVIDNEETDIVLSDTVEGSDMDELAGGVASQVQTWAKAGRSRE